MNNSDNELVASVTRLINQAGRSPYLFVGSGFSRRYLGTEDWAGLLRYLCGLASDEEFAYEKYQARADDDARYGKLPSVATLIDEDLRLDVLGSDRFSGYRAEHSSEIRAQKSPLKVLAAEHLASFSEHLEEGELEVLKEAGRRRIAGIITTNYDRLLEELFPGFATFVGQDDLLFQRTFEIGEIYKIHGSIDDPETMVLCAEDYKELDETRDYLAAKLLTIFVEYPIVFIGYSISDPDIQDILRSIVRCMKPEYRERLRDRFIFLERGENGISTHSITFGGVGTIEMTKVTTNNFGLVYRAIAESKSSFSPSVLRELRKSIYSLVEGDASTERLAVQVGFETLDELPEGQAFVLGVGTPATSEAAYGHMVKAEKLYEDVVLDNGYFAPKLVVKEYLPNLLRTNSGGLPMYKYLAGYDGEIEDPALRRQLAEKDSVDSFLNSSLRRTRGNVRARYPELSVRGIIEVEGPEKAFSRLYCLNEDEVDLEDLRGYLVDLLKGDKGALPNNSELKRLIRIYDFLKYKKAPDKSANSGRQTT